MMNNELKTIKKLYGEEMMHLCREMFPSILEKEGQLLNILTSNLAPTHSFANDIKEHNLYEKFKSWIYSFIDVEKENLVVTNKTPFELMDEAGYTLYECKSEEDIQSFRKYYAENEVLCTIYNGGRLNRCHVFFAVKKNVDEIKRENFTNPQRQDEYGTSVISIQFSRGKINNLSIKNRYNHTINNPDATFSNNLENIIPGLTNSFEKYYGLNISQEKKELSFFLTYNIPYIKGNDGKYYRYNIEMGGYYFCENNVVLDYYRNVIMGYTQNKEIYIVMERYVIDRKNKSIYCPVSSQNSFVKSINNVGKIIDIVVIRNGKNKTINIYYSNNKQVVIEINKNNAIIGYENNYIEKIDDYFLSFNKQLVNISLPKVKEIGDFFLNSNEKLSSISLPQVQTIGIYFLASNEKLSNISLPQVKRIGKKYLEHNYLIDKEKIIQEMENRKNEEVNNKRNK